VRFVIPPSVGDFTKPLTTIFLSLSPCILTLHLSSCGFPPPHTFYFPYISLGNNLDILHCPFCCSPTSFICASLQLYHFIFSRLLNSTSDRTPRLLSQKSVTHSVSPCFVSPDLNHRCSFFTHLRLCSSLCLSYLHNICVVSFSYDRTLLVHALL